MSPAVIAAMITSLASIVVAILAWLTARRTSAVQLDQQRKLEALRIAHEELAPVQAAANGLWENLQKLKHALDIILVDDHPEIEDAASMILKAATELSKDFAREGAVLPGPINRLWHGIKNKGVEVADLVNEYKNFARFDRGIPPKEKARILVFREELTKGQRALEAQLAEHRIELQKKYADLLRHGVEL